MKSYSSIVRMVSAMVLFDVMAPRHDEDAAVHFDDVDLRAVEAGKHGPIDDVIDGADSRLPVPEIENAIHRRQQRVELVGAEQHADAELRLNLANELNDLVGIVRIEARQRLVQQ